jgi:hypothetical protein
MRLALVLVILTGLAVPAAADTLGERLVRDYGSARGYRSIKREVLAWHGTTRNGCVAFVSTALRRLGLPVPQDGVDADGHGVSRITIALARHLEAALHWRRIDDPAALQPGDLVFTTDHPCCVGIPEHVFVFAAWHDRARMQALAIDNQGRRYVRALRPDAPTSHAAFAWALRAPD